MRWTGAACLAVVAVSVGGFLSVEDHAKILLALVGLVCAALAAGAQLRNGWLGLALLIVVAVVLPVEVGGSDSRAPFGASLPLALAICLVWFLDVAVLRQGKPVEWSRIVFSIFALMTATLLSFFAGQFPVVPSAGASYGAQVAQLMLFLASAGLVLAVGHWVRAVDQLQRLTWLFLTLGGLVCVIQIVSSLETLGRTAGPIFEIIDYVVISESIGSLFWVWLVSISLSQALFNRDLAPATRLAIGGITVLALCRGLALANTWVSGWLPPLISVGVILLWRLPRLTIITGVIVALVWLSMSPALSISTLIAPGEEYSRLTRMEAARVLWPLIMKSPFVGLGPANYHQYTLLVPILGWYVSFNSHNQYIDLLAQVGFIGLLAFSWFICEIAAIAWRSARVFRGGFCRSYAVGAIGGLAGTLFAGALADWIIPFYYNIGVRGFRSSLLCWFFLGGVLVLRRVGRTQLLPDTPAADQRVPVAMATRV